MMSGTFLGFLIACAVMVVLAAINNRRTFKKNKQHSKFQNVYNNSPDYFRKPDSPFFLPENHEDKILEMIHSDDPFFNKDDFIEFSKFMFCAYHKALSDGSLSSIRQYLQDDFYRSRQQTLTDFLGNGFFIMVNLVKIHRSYLHVYERDTTEEIVTVFITADINQYTLDKESNEIVDGNVDDVLHIHYFLKFLRKNGTKTGNTYLTDSCPQCSVPLRVNENGECVSCHTHLTAGEHGWVLCNLTRIFNFSDFDERGVILYQ